VFGLWGFSRRRCDFLCAKLVLFGPR
jgi:hypothetical protein